MHIACNYKMIIIYAYTIEATVTVVNLHGYSKVAEDKVLYLKICIYETV